MKKIAFVINPNAGGNRKVNRLDLIRKLVPAGLDHEFFLWKKREDKDELLQNVLNSDCDIVAAVGGDGTVNSVAAAVCGTTKTLAIIPFGSGNGLARHLGIPLVPEQAIRLLNDGHTVLIDTCYLNQQAFFCTAGIGFDAHIGKLFAESKSRGISGYAWMTFKEVSTYKPSTYTLTIDGQRSEHEAFLITLANAAQYGGKAYIAPEAHIQDGMIDLTIIRPFPLVMGPGLVYKLFFKSLKSSRYVEMLRGKHIVIERNERGPIQFDGESAEMGTRLEIRIVPASLKVIVP